MIPVKEAQACIAQYSSKLPAACFSLSEAAGHILAEDIYAITDIPAFRQSAMDGYAILFNEKNERLTVNGEMQAGAEKPSALKPKEAYRIFTGAPLPDGADTVVMQEKVKVKGKELLIEDQQLQLGANVRSKGAEVQAGALAVEKGARLTPAAIGFLAGIGITEVYAYPSPKTSIIVTGKELQKPGKELQFGQVYESNSFSLTAALKQAGITSTQLMEADDDLNELTSVLQNTLQNSDIVLLTGGVSVGDYDFVLEAAKLCGIEKLFHKVKQKPGKPLFFGRKDNKLIFGLPGNPSSVLSCFYQYVLPSIEKIMGKSSSVKVLTALLTHDYKKASGLTHFLKGSYTDGKATPLSAQESFRLSSFAYANCMICLEEERADYMAGETVEVHLLPE
ncbi:MAG TPA: molybdopterin molybdenumtransferase MoeA [Sphingobacteriaceae bacterium]|nr:molybdopterin molybdenumtransferase MoeA [Sphingobacteriaceae bacterium]